MASYLLPILNWNFDGLQKYEEEYNLCGSVFKLNCQKKLSRDVVGEFTFGSFITVEEKS